MIPHGADFLLYSASLERGNVLLHIKRGRGNRPDEASATCQSGVVPSPAESRFSARRMSSDGRKEKV
jgi:hypothetical protein